MNLTNKDPINSISRILTQSFRSGRTYFVFDKDDNLIAGPIGKDGALIRTFHGHNLYYTNAKDMIDMKKFSIGDVKDAIRVTYPKIDYTD